MELVEVGYISKTHGIKGELILREEHPVMIGELKALFIDMAGARAPFFIKAIKEAANGLIVSLEDVDTIEKARTLVGKKVLADARFLELEDDAGHDWVGYELIDRHFGPMGHITAVSDNGQQALLTVIFREKEIILPMVDEFIERVEEKERKLYFNAPEGLIDVYLGAGEE